MTGEGTHVNHVRSPRSHSRDFHARFLKAMQTARQPYRLGIRAFFLKPGTIGGRVPCNNTNLVAACSQWLRHAGCPFHGCGDLNITHGCEADLHNKDSLQRVVSGFSIPWFVHADRNARLLQSSSAIYFCQRYSYGCQKDAPCYSHADRREKQGP